VLGLQLERKRAWVALYRAAGGGWQRPEPLAGQTAVVN
jgi:outer membrane protein TolC